LKKVNKNQYHEKQKPLSVVRWTWSKGNSCCASGRCLGSQHCCLGWADRDDSFYGKNFDVCYSTSSTDFENQTQVYNLD